MPQHANHHPVPQLVVAALLATACGSSVDEQAGPDPAMQGSCAFITDSLALTFSTFDGRTSQCGNAQSTGSSDEVVVEGSIHTAPGGGWEIDSCSPNADCLPMISTIVLAGDTPAIPDGAFVRARIFESVDPGGTCYGQQLTIENLAEWDSVPNSISPNAHAWLFAGLGVASLPSDGPFTVERVAACGSDPDDYTEQRVEHVVVSTAGADSVRVGQSLTVEWTVDDGPQAGRYDVRNVRCQYGCCHGGPCDYRIARMAD